MAAATNRTLKKVVMNFTRFLRGSTWQNSQLLLIQRTFTFCSIWMGGRKESAQMSSVWGQHHSKSHLWVSVALWVLTISTTSSLTGLHHRKIHSRSCIPRRWSTCRIVTSRMTTSNHVSMSSIWIDPSGKIMGYLRTSLSLQISTNCTRSTHILSQSGWISWSGCLTQFFGFWSTLLMQSRICLKRLKYVVLTDQDLSLHPKHRRMNISTGVILRTWLLITLLRMDTQPHVTCCGLAVQWWLFQRQITCLRE